MEKLLSGIKPTGEIHIGNYFGAMKQFLDMQDKYECYIFIADYHALNQVNDAKQLSSNIIDIAKAYLAIGLDPKKVALFKQSDIRPVTELCWIFNSITPISLLQRAHAYKDAKAKNKTISMGLFDYPVLMAADILIYDSDVVPVGQDQKQHIEIAQEIARNFNNIYGKTFKVPRELIRENVAVVNGIDGQKMSKSYENTIGLFDEDEAIKKKVMSIVTDSKKADEPKDPETCNVFSLHKLFSQDQLIEIRDRYIKGDISYKKSKEILLQNIIKFLAPIRQRKSELDKDSDYIKSVLEQGKEKAMKLASHKISEVRSKIGVELFFN